jgi:hypothetical protein
MRHLSFTSLVVRAVAIIICVVCAVCAACAVSSYRVTPVRSGALYASKGDACGIRFENLNFMEGASKYQQLGLVTLTGTSGDEFTDPMKADVEKAACHMGGDAVSLNASAPGAFQFFVWRGK